MNTRPLRIARWNAAMLLAILYLQDAFWLAASRINIAWGGPFYSVAPWDWLLFGAVTALATIFTITGLIAAEFSRPIRRAGMPRWAFVGLVAAAVGFNLLRFALVGSSARYTSGGLTGTAGLVYSIAMALTLASMVSIIRQRQSERSVVGSGWVWLLAGSHAVNIDGLASALTLAVFLVLILPRLSVRTITLLAIVGTGLAWVGFSAKFSELPDYVTPEFMGRWVIARFAIQAESMYTYIAGESLIRGFWDYTDILSRSVSNRLDLVLGTPISIEYPRSVSEALFFDMQGFFGGGSSPGLLLGTALQGPIFWVLAPAIYGFLFVQLFYGFTRRLSFLALCAMGFLLKGLHANFTEFFTIVSPTLFTVLSILLVCLFQPSRRAIAAADNARGRWIRAIERGDAGRAGSQTRRRA